MDGDSRYDSDHNRVNALARIISMLSRAFLISDACYVDGPGGVAVAQLLIFTSPW